MATCVLRDNNSNNCTHSGNVCCCTYMVNNDYDKFSSFSRLNMTLIRHRTSTYLHGKADRFLVAVSNGQVAALSDWTYYQYALGKTSNYKVVQNKKSMNNLFAQECFVWFISYANKMPELANCVFISKRDIEAKAIAYQST